MANENKTSAQVEMEVEEQRHRLEDRVNEIQERLSPGQLVDEFLSYAKNSGGREFMTNFGRTVQANPLPIALTGIGLAWLMARANAPAEPAMESASDRDWDRRLSDNGQSYDRGDHLGEAYPYARIKGSSLRRVQNMTDEAGRRYSEFTDEAGSRFKALSDEVGNRAGHFADQAGTLYGGFTDEAGNRISDFFDEAGTRLDDAQGWAADTWQSAGERLGDLTSAAAARASDLRQRATAAGGQLQSGAGAMTKTLTGLMHDQPLIGGALAFAVGAAIASALPPTEQEDQLVGKTSDELKAQGAKLAGDAYETGKQQVAETYDDVREQAATLYDEVKHNASGNGHAVENG